MSSKSKVWGKSNWCGIHPYELYKRLKSKNLITWDYSTFYNKTWSQYKKQKRTFYSLLDYYIWLNDWKRNGRR